MAPKTALLLIDPYNDFLHTDGKLYNVLAESIRDTNTIEHLHEAVKTARAVQIPIVYCMHQQTNKHSFMGWQNMNKAQQALSGKQVFEEGTFGAQFFEGLQPDFDAGDFIVSKHWNSSSFANTDLDIQLRQRGITHIVLAGLITNTCVEATARYGYELGYEITMLSDATAGFSTEKKNAAVTLIWPLFANRNMVDGSTFSGVLDARYERKMFVITKSWGIMRI